MRSSAALAALLSCVALVSGCAAGTPSPVPTVTVTVEAAVPVPSETPAVARNSESPLDVWDAYLSCKYISSQFLFTKPGEFASVTFDRFEQSVVHLRADGLYYVYVEYENPNYEAGFTDYYAATCLLGGTLDDLHYESYGNTERLTPEQIAVAAEADVPTG